MRTRIFVVALGVVLVAAGSCRATTESPPTPAFRPTSTIKDIMVSIVDPEADVLWNAVATVISEAGTEERAPSTEEEWAAVQRGAIQLIEASNLLLIPGRKVATPGDKSSNPGIELEPEAIHKLIADDPATWSTLARGLYDATLPGLKAIDAKDAKGLFDAGEHIDRACESCHQHYWYPPKSASAWTR